MDPSNKDQLWKAEPAEGSRKMGGIVEYEEEKSSTGTPSPEPLGRSEWGRSSYSLCSVDRYSGRFSPREVNSPTHQPNSGNDCATLILTCLFCKFSDFLLMLPDMCENTASLCCPSFKYQHASTDQTASSDCICNCEFDCSLFDACHETTECLELAMEISEICYR
nr:PREDICTED: myoD family inhibitor domain-containing protein-like isoform X2 [Lepisosteus oculatus]